MDAPRIPEGFLLTTVDYDVTADTEWSEHQHEHHELLWSVGGIAQLEAGGRVWTIPPTLGVWIPSGTPHRASAPSAAQIRATFFTSTDSNCGEMPDTVTGIAISEPLRALLVHNIQAQLTPEARLRLQRVVLDLLLPAPQASFDLNMPTSGHLRTIASTVLTAPADRRTTADWAQQIGMHERTLARQFEAETGITFTKWRILARLQIALRELASGCAVVSVSRKLGYRSPSTFIEHFREFTGQTPAEYARSGGSGCAEDVRKSA